MGANICIFFHNKKQISFFNKTKKPNSIDCQAFLVKIYFFYFFVGIINESINSCVLEDRLATSPTLSS